MTDGCDSKDLELRGKSGRKKKKKDWKKKGDDDFSVNAIGGSSNRLRLNITKQFVIHFVTEYLDCQSNRSKTDKADWPKSQVTFWVAITLWARALSRFHFSRSQVYSLANQL